MNRGAMQAPRTLIFLAFALPLAAGPPTEFSPGDWKTDTSKSSINLKELQRGGPPKDGIPALRQASFESINDASKWLDSRQPVVVVEKEGEARAYPLAILIWHEMVNDSIAGRPILVSYCPLCNSAVVFDRTVGSDVLDFGVSGMLRQSDMVMFDRQTDSLWQQITGEGLVGAMTGRHLAVVSSQLVPFGAFAQQYPRGKVLSRSTGYDKPYGHNPYVGYEAAAQTMFPVKAGKRRDVLGFDRLLVVSVGGRTKAYPFSALRKQGVIHDELGGRPVVVFFDPAMRSAVDSELMAVSSNSGAAGAFFTSHGRNQLSFHVDSGLVRDNVTNSTWSVLGYATGGALVGQRLEAAEQVVTFAFAWLAFRPETEVFIAKNISGR